MYVLGFTKDIDISQFHLHVSCGKVSFRKSTSTVIMR